MLGSHIMGPNNMIVERKLERLGLDHRTAISHGFYGNLHKGEPGVSSKIFFWCGLSDSSPQTSSKELSVLLVLLFRTS